MVALQVAACLALVQYNRKLSSFRAGCELVSLRMKTTFAFTQQCETFQDRSEETLPPVSAFVNFFYERTRQRLYNFDNFGKVHPYFTDDVPSPFLLFCMVDENAKGSIKYSHFLGSGVCLLLFVFLLWYDPVRQSTCFILVSRLLFVSYLIYDAGFSTPVVALLGTATALLAFGFCMLHAQRIRTAYRLVKESKQPSHDCSTAALGSGLRASRRKNSDIGSGDNTLLEEEEDPPRASNWGLHDPMLNVSSVYQQRRQSVFRFLPVLYHPCVIPLCLQIPKIHCSTTETVDRDLPGTLHVLPSDHTSVGVLDPGANLTFVCSLRSFDRLGVSGYFGLYIASSILIIFNSIFNVRTLIEILGPKAQERLELMYSRRGNKEKSERARCVYLLVTRLLEPNRGIFFLSCFTLAIVFALTLAAAALNDTVLMPDRDGKT